MCYERVKDNMVIRREKYDGSMNRNGVRGNVRVIYAKNREDCLLRCLIKGPPMCKAWHKLDENYACDRNPINYACVNCATDDYCSRSKQAFIVNFLDGLQSASFCLISFNCV